MLWIHFSDILILLWLLQKKFKYGLWRIGKWLCVVCFKAICHTAITQDLQMFNIRNFGCSYYIHGLRNSFEFHSFFIRQCAQMSVEGSGSSKFWSIYVVCAYFLVKRNFYVNITFILCSCAYSLHDAYATFWLSNKLQINSTKNGARFTFESLVTGL